jgi:hypothetical protein
LINWLQGQDIVEVTNDGVTVQITGREFRQFLAEKAPNLYFAEIRESLFKLLGSSDQQVVLNASHMLITYAPSLAPHYESE